MIMACKSACILFSLVLAVATATRDTTKVRVGYYAESLCPDCLAFSNGPMNKAVKEIGNIFDLTYVPWGNAKLNSGKFDCQHGEMECLINTVDACVIHFYPERAQFWPFIQCMDEMGEDQDYSVAEACAKKPSINMNWSMIDSCTKGALGHQLELMYANITNSLQPPHKYTPWVTINGKHDPDAEDDGLITQICKAYTGLDVPPTCTQTA